ncbi:MAG: HAD family phosphatase [Thermoplasmata archaeon]|nr:HAD family phosphatase [Thermoplasmata archaeon]
MGNVSLLLWDVGGVLLSNGWDHTARRAAAVRFELDGDEFERRHQRVDAALETGQISWEEYLSTTVFDVPREFSREEFGRFVREQSTAKTANLNLARELRKTGGFTMAALNNESRELNQYRIDTFGLREVFHVFFSSCYTGLRKPDPAAYRYALQLTQRAPDESVFLDDRPENVSAAAGLGIRTVLVGDPARLRADLSNVGVAGG